MLNDVSGVRFLGCLTGMGRIFRKNWGYPIRPGYPYWEGLTSLRCKSRLGYVS